jgi:hypothetical protein
MPPHRRGQYTFEVVILAVQSTILPTDGRTHVLSQNVAASTYGVPRSTISHYSMRLPAQLTNSATTSHDLIRDQLVTERLLQKHAAHNARAAMSSTNEALLVGWIKEMQALCHCVPPSAVKDKAEELLTNQRGHTVHVGKHWASRFIARYPDIAHRVAESLRLSKQRAVSRETIAAWFSLYKQFSDGLGPDQIFSGDETGIKGDVVTRVRVLAKRGSRDARAAGGSDADHTSILHFANARGVSLPPVIVLKGSGMHPDMHRGEIDGTEIGTSESGFFNQSHFPMVIRHIIAHTQIRPLLLIIDGAECHLSMEAMNICRDNDIRVLALPSHHSHILQVADVGVFSSFKTHWKRICDDYHRAHPNAILNRYNVMPLIGSAWRQSMTAENVVAGFRHTGTYPFNPDVISDDQLRGARSAPSHSQLDQTTTTSLSSLSSSTSASSSSSSRDTIPERTKRRRIEAERTVLDNISNRLHAIRDSFSEVTANGLEPTDDDIENWNTTVTQVKDLINQHSVIRHGYSATNVPTQSAMGILTVPDPPSSPQPQRRQLIQLERGALLTADETMRQWNDEMARREEKRAARGRGRGRPRGRGRGRGGHGGGDVISVDD